MGGMMSIVVILIYAIFFFIMALIALIPSVIRAIGIARICNKIGAFKPVWSWVWAFLFPPVAILRAGDVAAARENPNRHKMLAHGLIATGVYIVFMVLALGCMAVFAMISETANSALLALAMIASLLFAILGFLAAVWMAVPSCISHFRIFKLYMPDWGAWLTLAGMILLSDFAFLIMPILSFIPMKKTEQQDTTVYDTL